MSPIVEQKKHCTHIRFKSEDLVNLAQLHNMSLIFRLEDGSYLTMTCDLPEDQFTPLLNNAEEMVNVDRLLDEAVHQ
jgi:hypothetical protein